MKTSNVLEASHLTPQFAELLGDGSGVVGEAAISNCAQIEPVHFLCFLARQSRSVLRTRFLEVHRCDPETACAHLYRAGLAEDRPAGMPIAFDAETLSPASHQLLDDFAGEQKRLARPQGSEELFLSVLFRHLSPAVLRAIEAASGPEGFIKFRGELERVAVRGAAEAPSIFDEQGRLREEPFDRSGRRVLNLLREETAGFGAARASAMHLLYALVGIESGLFQRALQFQGIDPLKEVHAPLSRALLRPGATRLRDFELTQTTLHASVQTVLEAAAGEAHRQGLLISEVLIAQAVATGQVSLITEFLAGRKVAPDTLAEYLAHAEAETEPPPEYLRLSVSEIEGELKQRLLGQDYVIQRLLPWVKRLRFGFPRERGPAAVFLFLGPSGTGKTQLAKELARAVYGSEEEMVMLEMGQFNTKESINIFIGAPPGYVGYGEGKLTNGLRDRPRSVVLFDEVEKAHEDVWVALMRFLDEGLISDPAGPTRDGRGCIIVLTSNLGGDRLGQLLPADGSAAGPLNVELERAIRDAVLPYLKRPEIYNRVDDKLVFLPFDLSVYGQLVQRNIDLEVRKFRALCGATIEVPPAVLSWLAERALEAKQEGARCVPRLVNQFVVAPVIDVLTRQEDHTPARVRVGLRGDRLGTVVEEG